MHPARRVLAWVVAATLAFAPAVARASNCAGTSTGHVPLIDLGPGLYLGQFQGGLYPGGSNAVPAAHATAGVAAAATIAPRALDGTPDSQHGKIVLISVGMSNTTDEFCGGSNSMNCVAQSFMGQAAVGAAVNHDTLVIVDGAQGGQAAGQWVDPNAPTYATVKSRLASLGVSEAQVQAVWVKQADPGPTLSLPSASADAYGLEGRLGAIARALKVRYPNVQQVFFSSRIYAGYASTTLNPEPYAYESGFAVKWLVAAQITQMATAGHPPDPTAGDLDYTTVAPWIAWAAYLWADGTTPRSDGLSYACSDFQSDGTHPATAAVQKVGSLLLGFFETAAATPWFRSGVAGTTTTTVTSTTLGATTTLPPCPAAPVSGCAPAAAHGAQLSLRRATPTTGDALRWRWTAGTPVAAGDLGTATTTTGYRLCVYDGHGLALGPAAPAGRTCRGRPCWKATRTGFCYVDNALDPDGLQKICLAAGAARQARISVKGRGALLPPPPLPLMPPVRVQLHRTDDPHCWDAHFDGTPARNDRRQFQGRSD